MKICLVSPLPPPLGGMGIWTKTVLDYFSKQDNDVSFFVINTSPNWRSIYNMNKLVRVIGGSFQLLANCFSFIKYIKKSDCCHLCTSGSLALFRDMILILICNVVKKPVVYHLHYGRIPDISQRLTLEWKLLKRNIRRSTIVLTLDNYTTEVLSKNFPKKNIQKMPNPIQKNYDISDLTNKIATFVGWNIPSKGIEDLLCAWEQLTNNKEWMLQIIGPGDQRYIDEISKKYIISSNITFLGEKAHDETLQLMRQSSIFILPSHTEAFPMVILEAMSLGLAIIATDVGDISEMINQNCGLLIKPKDVSALNKSIDYLMVNGEKRFELGRNARKKVSELYITDIVLANLYHTWLSCSYRELYHENT